MEQALINILKNAVEALRRRRHGDGSLDRDVRRARHTSRSKTPARASPTRRGAQLFTPFFTTKQNGQGIGLTMVQEILRRHGFAYSLDGPPGGPTRFRISLGSP